MVQVERVPQGSSIYKIHPVITTVPPNSKGLGYAPRSDRRPLSPEERLSQIVIEGRRLGAMSKVQLDQNTSVAVFTTSQPSPHTIFGGPYEGSMELWSKTRKSFGFEADISQIVGEDGGKVSAVPSHLLTWVVLECRDEKGAQYMPIRLPEVAHAVSQNAPVRLIQQGGGIHILREQLADILRSVDVHLRVQRQYVETQRRLVERRLREVLSVHSAQFDYNMPLTHVAEWMPLGYARTQEDIAQGLGLGAKSNPNTHFHTQLMLTRAGREAVIRYLNTGRTFERGLTPDILGSISLVELTESDKHDLASPISRHFHHSLNAWILSRLGSVLTNHEIKDSKISSVNDPPILESQQYCATVGWSIGVREPVSFDKIVTALLIFKHSIDEVWLSGRKAWEEYVLRGSRTELDEFVHRHSFKPGVVRILRSIQPSDEQKTLWSITGINEGPKKGDAELEHGKNVHRIPGVPTFGFEFMRNNEGAVVSVLIHVLLSEKSIAESHSGGPIKR